MSLAVVALELLRRALCPDVCRPLRSDVGIRIRASLGSVAPEPGGYASARFERCFGCGEDE